MEEIVILIWQEYRDLITLVSTDNLCASHPSMVFIHVKESKTDRLRCGANVSLGQTGESICLVEAVLHLGKPIWVHSSGTRWAKPGICGRSKEGSLAAGMASHKISGQRFHIGVAMTMAQNGASEAEIKALGRWKSRQYQGL